MKELEHDLNLAIEECSEIIKNINKAQRFGLFEVSPYDDWTNAQLIIHEVHDFLYVARYIGEVHGLNIHLGTTEEGYQIKKAKIERYKEISRQMGKID